MNSLIHLALVLLTSVSPLNLSHATVDAAASTIDHVDVVLPFSTDAYEILIPAGQKVTITMRGQSITDLDLYIYDEDGDLVISDTDSSSYASLWVRAGSTQYYSIHVKNLGARSNRYTLSLRRQWN